MRPQVHQSTRVGAVPRPAAAPALVPQTLQTFIRVGAVGRCCKLQLQSLPHSSVAPLCMEFTCRSRDLTVLESTAPHLYVTKKTPGHDEHRPGGGRGTVDCHARGGCERVCRERNARSHGRKEQKPKHTKANEKSRESRSASNNAADSVAAKTPFCAAGSARVSQWATAVETANGSWYAEVLCSGFLLTYFCFLLISSPFCSLRSFPLRRRLHR